MIAPVIQRARRMILSECHLVLQRGGEYTPQTAAGIHERFGQLLTIHFGSPQLSRVVAISIRRHA
jgi:hypothetical protein